MKTLALLAAACAIGANAAPTGITPQDAWHLRHDHGGHALIVDIRGLGEVLSEGATVGSDVNVPYLRSRVARSDAAILAGDTLPHNPHFLARMDEALAQARLRHTDPVILVCRTGELSRRAAELLEEHGYGDVRIVMGGFEGARAPGGTPLPGWKKAGLPWSRQLLGGWMRR